MTVYCDCCEHALWRRKRCSACDKFYCPRCLVRHTPCKASGNEVRTKLRNRGPMISNGVRLKAELRELERKTGGSK